MGMMTYKFSLFVLLLVFAIANALTKVPKVPMPGAPIPQDPNDPKFMDIAWKAAKYVNEDSSSSYVMVPIKVTQAWSHVVAGFNYYLKVLYGESTCEKAETDPSGVSPDNCQYRENGERALYRVKFYARPWEKYEHITVRKIRDVNAEEEI